MSVLLSWHTAEEDVCFLVHTKYQIRKPLDTIVDHRSENSITWPTVNEKCDTGNTLMPYLSLSRTCTGVRVAGLCLFAVPRALALVLTSAHTVHAPSWPWPLTAATGGVAGAPITPRLPGINCMSERAKWCSHVITISLDFFWYSNLTGDKTHQGILKTTISLDFCRFCYSIYSLFCPVKMLAPCVCFVLLKC